MNVGASEGRKEWKEAGRLARKPSLYGNVLLKTGSRGRGLEKTETEGESK